MHRVRQAGSDIPRDKALDYVAGYCIGLDMTARGQEDRSYRKSIDSYSVLGPWFVTADEIPDPDKVPLRIFVNGEKKQESNTSMLIFDCKKLIEWGSTFYTWHPGDILFTGTPEGVSPVQPGDTMRAVIDPIGEMSVAVRAHKAGANEGNDAMLQVKRIGHATLTTPDLERQLDYYTRVLGLCTVAREKNRAILATKPGQEAIVLEHGDRPAGITACLPGCARKRPRRAVGTPVQGRAQIRDPQRHHPRHRAGDRVRRSQGHQRRGLLGLFVRQGRRRRHRNHAASSSATSRFTRPTWPGR